MKYFALTSLLITLCLPFSSIAQLSDDEVSPCGINLAEDELRVRYAHEPNRLRQIEDDIIALEVHTQKFAERGAAKSSSTFVIPVVFHVIHDNGTENISDEQIYNAVELLNKDFNQQNSNWQTVNPAFLGIIADVGIEFRLAQQDPSGNCTNGITRTTSLLTYEGDHDMQDLIQWNRAMYLNIWVCANLSSGAAAYSQYPGSVNNSPESDGIVSRHNYIGSIGTGSVSRTTALSHEVGHWLNLRHVWGNSNDPNLSTNCNGDDLVSDTPETIGWTSCNTNAQSCGSLDNVENYMDYAACRKMFTEGQKNRMLAALNSSTAQRNQLWQNSNLSNTGTEGPALLCAANLSSNFTIVCAGDSVVFSDNSYNGATGWEWGFPGGSPAVSTIESPVIYYNTPGVYDVSLTANNSATTVNTTKAQYITVLSADGYPLPYQESFENLSSIPSNDWFSIDKQNDGGFQITSSAAYTGSQCAKLTNNTNDAGNLDELLSNTIDLNGMQEATISFKYAFKRRNSNNDDRLRFYVSNNCGQTWSLRKQLRGQTNLSTGNTQSSSFTPNNQSDWQEAIIDNIQFSFLGSGFRFKFWFESDGGNNLYIDDININGNPVGIEELTAESIRLNIFPNPITNISTLSFELEERSDVRMDVVDMLGRTILTIENESLSQGRHQYPISRSELGNGMYFVRVSINGKTSMVKFMVN